MEYSQIPTLAASITKNISSVIVGREEEIRLVITALLAGGHVLLEDVPGTGKTTLAKSLAKSLDCSFSRVQFTPDLLPADITGMRIFSRESDAFTFVKGPVFTHVLLADEINRATPRTQSALLECMEEHQVTEGGVTYALNQPFLVIATQNPVETQGTFPLPEAQLDRFLLRLSLGYPDEGEALTLMQRFLNAQPLQALAPVAAAEQITAAAALVKTCAVSEDVMRYMDAICHAARDPQKVRLGPSPRALLALMRCAQAYAAICGRDFVIPDDVKTLAVPVLAHRVILRGMHQQTTGEDLIRDVLSRTPVPTEERA